MTDLKTISLGETTVTLKDGTQSVVKIEAHERRSPRYVRPKYGRGYYSPTQAEYVKKPRIYPSFDGESLLQNLANRTTRPAGMMGKALRLAMQDLGLAGRISWSQKAGCSCPCSPGWIWHEAPLLPDMYRYDVWVSFSNIPAAKDDEDSMREQLARAGQVIMDPTMPDVSKVVLA